MALDYTYPKYDVDLTPAMLQECRGIAVRLLHEVGFLFPHERVIAQISGRPGIRIEGQRVYFDTALAEQYLAQTIAAWQAKAPPQPKAPGKDEPWRVRIAGVSMNVVDMETDEIRLATCQDLADLSRVVDAIPGLGRAHPTFIPQDVPRPTAELHAFATIILNSSQPHRVSVYTADYIDAFYEIETIARGGDAEAVRANPTFACKLWFNSPFMITEENVRIAMRARELFGQPIEISIMPVAGSSTPVTVAGCMVHQTAESIVCNIITLAVDGRLTGYRCGALATDMRTGTHTQSGPDVDLLQLASSQMAEFCFGGRASVARGPTTTAKVPGAQSMMEKSIATFFAIMGGTRSFGSLATLAVADIGSVVQLMLDLEMMEYFQRMLDGVEVDAERLAEEVICEVSPTGARFLEHEHTLEYYRRELFSPELANRRVAGAWISDPTSMIDRARAKAKRLVESAPNCCPLSAADRKAIQAILDAADQEAAMAG